MIALSRILAQTPERQTTHPLLEAQRGTQARPQAEWPTAERPLGRRRGWPEARAERVVRLGLGLGLAERVVRLGLAERSAPEIFMRRTVRVARPPRRGPVATKVWTIRAVSGS